MKKIISIIFISMMLLFAACSTTTEVVEPTYESSDNEREYVAPEDNEVYEQETSDNEVVEVEEVEIAKEEGDKVEEAIVEEKLEFLIGTKDFSEQTTYSSPGGDELITIDLSVEDDVITEINVISDGGNHPTSKGYIRRVNDEVSDIVVGMNIADVELPAKISSSSLTTAAISKKLNEIKNI